MEVGVVTGTYKATVVVSGGDGFIIGADFLAAHDCDLSLHQKLFAPIITSEALRYQGKSREVYP